MKYMLAYLYTYTQGFPGGASGKEPACQRRRSKRCRLDPWVGQRKSIALCHSVLKIRNSKLAAPEERDLSATWIVGRFAHLAWPLLHVALWINVLGGCV